MQSLKNLPCSLASGMEAWALSNCGSSWFSSVQRHLLEKFVFIVAAMPAQGEIRVDEFDGEHLLGRTTSFGAKGAAVGAFYGACASALTPPQPAPTPLILQSLTLMARSAVLIGSVAGIFAGTTSTMAIIRQKDDFKNWMVGGAVSGSLFGLTRRSWGVGAATSAALAVAGGVAKYSGVYKQPFRTDRIYL